MTLEQFAKKCGFILLDDCGPEWGGRYGYTTTNDTNVNICGYKTPKKAMEGWMRSTFGEKAAKVVKSLLEVTHDPR
jgi:hypothetical protein